MNEQGLGLGGPPQERDDQSNRRKGLFRLRQRGARRLGQAAEWRTKFVGIGTVYGDGLVSNRSQYPPDLQQQGIPAYPFPSTHWMVLRSQKGAELTARLVREPQPRRDAKQVESVRRRIPGG